MNKVQSGYLLGIGSNIEPESNIAEIVRLLSRKLPKLTVSRVLSIPPIGMNSQRDFLNVVMFVETGMAEDELKAICNEIEITLGRDRQDPERKTKDRTADLDILSKASFPEDGERPVSTITDEYFLYPLLEEMNAYLSGREYLAVQAGVEITIGELTLGQTATTINRDTCASDERVSE